MNSSPIPRKDFSRKRCIFFFSVIALFIVAQHLYFTDFGKYTLNHIDFTSQHYRFPEYFRELFYSTGELFPDYAANIGGGQNIYNFSYYGLYNPIILFSYLLPFVPMKLYIQITAYLSVYIASILLHKWLSKRFSQRICEYSSIFFVLAAPLLYHCHRHVMFISYMPFVILALMGVDRFFERKRSGLLALSVCLICLTSYFYSIGAIIGITVYGIFRYLELCPDTDIKNFIKKGVSFAFVIVLGVAMAAFLLLPTFLALLSGRAEGGSVITLKQILLPTVDADSLLYSVYSPGLSAFSLLALVSCIAKKRSAHRFLSVSLILPVFLPIILYALNAAMYIDAKVLIPLIPLYILIAASTLDSVLNNEYPDKWALICFSLIILISVCLDFESRILLAETVVLVIFVLISNRYKKPMLLISVSLIAVLVSFAVNQLSDEKKPVENLLSNKLSEQITKELTEKDSDLYRISDRTMNLEIANRVLSEEHYTSSVYSSLSNQNYAHFYYDLIGNEIMHRSRGQMTNTDNPLFDIYMGNKYVIDKRSNTNGYTPLKDYGPVTVYRNENALPIAYQSSRIMSVGQYESLSFPYNTEALLNFIICEDAPDVEIDSSITEIDIPDFEIVSSEGLEITKTDKGYIITSKKGGMLELKLDDRIADSLFFVRFDLESRNTKSEGDNTVKINGRINKRPYSGWKYDNQNSSFEYIFNHKGQRNFEIRFAGGSYTLENLQFFIADYDEFVSQINDVTALTFDTKNCKGDILEGDITVTEKGYLHFSIPYDKGYTLYIDGKKIDCEMTDAAFIGAKTDPGTHHVRLEYQAPGAALGRIISLGALCTLSALSIYERYRKRKS